MNTPVKIAIAGLGNCANSLIQGIAFYGDADPAHEAPGLMNIELGGYHVGNLEVVAVFDVDSEKVGADVAKGMWAGRNDTIRFADVPDLGDPRPPGAHPRRARPLLPRRRRGVAPKRPSTWLPPSTPAVQTCSCRISLSALSRRPASTPRRRSRPASASSTASPSSSHPTRSGRERFAEAGVPIIGDDIKSQVGATIVHRTLARLFEDRGLVVDRTYQLNVGGNMDFRNMLERERLESKKISKTQSVTSQIDRGIGSDDVHIGPSDHVPWLTDRKWAFIRIEGRGFGDVPLNAELKLEVWDSPNSAGVVIDAVRCIKLAKDRGIGGPLLAPSSYFMKSPPVQYRDGDARDHVEAFVAGEDSTATDAVAYLG